jgi:phosphatidylglycerol---prolipoprotein diacylglyceryl transferase
MPLASIPSPPHAGAHLGPVTLRWQALAVVAGILLAIWLAGRRYRKAGGPRGAITDVAAWAVPAGLIPAAIGALTAEAHGGWQTVRAWDAVLGFPGALALGTLGAWLACHRLRAGQPPKPSKPPKTPGASGAAASADTGEAVRPVVTIAPVITATPIATLVKGGRRLRFGPVAAAAAPAIAFGQAVAAIGNWFSQQGFGHPSSLPWAVTIAPAHRPAGYENFATFQPIFLYQALWAVAAGVGVAVATGRLSLRGDWALALYAATYAAGGFALFWLGIGHLPVVFGLRAGELGDAAVLVGAAVYLVRTRPTRIKAYQPAHKSALESDSPVM